jgi:hypothetical protein
MLKTIVEKKPTVIACLAAPAVPAAEGKKQDIKNRVAEKSIHKKAALTNTGKLECTPFIFAELAGGSKRRSPCTTPRHDISMRASDRKSTCKTEAITATIFIAAARRKQNPFGELSPRRAGSHLADKPQTIGMTQPHTATYKNSLPDAIGTIGELPCMDISSIICTFTIINTSQTRDPLISKRAQGLPPFLLLLRMLPSTDFHTKRPTAASSSTAERGSKNCQPEPPMAEYHLKATPLDQRNKQAHPSAKAVEHIFRKLGIE